MKKLLHKTGAKLAAVVLFAVFTAAAAASFIGVVYMQESSFFDNSGYSFYDSHVCVDITYGYAKTVYFQYLPLTQQLELSEEEAFELKKLEASFSPDNTNFLFTVRDETGATLLTNYTGQDYGAIQTYQFNATSYEQNGSSVSYTPMTVEEYEELADKTYDVTCYVKDPITAQDRYYSPYTTSEALYASRYLIVAATVISAVLALVVFIFLMCSAGRKKDRDEIVLSGLNKLPLDLYVAVAVLIAVPLTNVAFSYGGFMHSVWWAMGITAVLTMLGLLVLSVCMSFAARVKAGRWWENTIIYRILRLIRRALRSLLNGIGEVFRNLPLLWKAILLFIAYLFINIVFALLLLGGLWRAGILFGLLFNLAALVGLCLLLLQLNALKRAGERIAAGDFESKVDTKRMHWDIKSHAEALNNIQRGMARAVEERLKSERLKTELITNVSHDIKTPLTSIVNYVDLLKKEPIESETVREYIVVLDRQSSRLKKLTEDLVEASKASTGNVALDLKRTDVAELLNQSAGEYAERFESCSLELVMSAGPGELFVLADGRLLWRVFDNLLGNICKYAQPGTRVYVDAARVDGKAEITLKNISRYPLNVASDELLERFVRGDASRATDGSGLGLSIARSLTELQKGIFALTVDGDLFKVTIRFEAWNGTTP